MERQRGASSNEETLLQGHFFCAAKGVCYLVAADATRAVAGS